ncbi:hypothetical protein GYU96_07970 [Lactobacillus mellis]|uniref:hypothetical protein n=1 Tax=Bombilactobacillus mellis TaxID=1218508 RepID=UPI00158045BB|nr:hypothetical protein [Bombilactobacillus mellis]NUG67789.1 hypothetical protein [Bombilactobacillus mellis]
MLQKPILNFYSWLWFAFGWKLIVALLITAVIITVVYFFGRKPYRDFFKNKIIFARRALSRYRYIKNSRKKSVK